MKIVPFILATVIAIAAFYLGLTGQKFWFINDSRSATIALFAAGFVMCSTGQLGQFIMRGPAHPLAILGYLFGAVALFAGIVQIFNIKVSFFSDTKNAFLIIAVAIAIKFIIGRLSFLLPAAK